MAMTEWKGQEAESIVFKDVGDRVNAAGRWFRDQLRHAVSIPNALIESLPGGGTRVKPGSKGKHPSAPGEYPRKVTGWHRKNIQAEYDASKLVARVGSNVPYAKTLEIGSVRMKPRPWLSNGIRDFLRGILIILRGEGGISVPTSDPQGSGGPAAKALARAERIYKTKDALNDLKNAKREKHEGPDTI